MDYSALAKKYNGTVDYSALAKQNNGFPTGEPSSITQAFKNKMGVDVSGHAFNISNPQGQQNLENITKGSTTSLGKNFVTSVPAAIEETAIASPVKLATSLGEGIVQTVKTGGKENVSGHTYHVPGLEPFKSFQSDAKETNSPLVPLKIGLAGLDTITGLEAGEKGVTKLAKLGAKIDARAGGLATEKIGKQVADETAKQFDKLAGTITQGKTTDLSKAKAALTSIDIKNVKTYKDLSEALDSKIKTISSKLDEAYSTKTNPIQLADLTVNSKVGGQNISHNYVQDALSQLKDLFTKTNDPEGLTRISQLEQKAGKEGLTIKEVNDLAKEHGQQLSGFNANGEAASGLSKQAAENTRTGLKGTARQFFKDPVSQAADEQLSNLITTRKLADDVAENVNKLQNKIQERGLGEKLGRFGGKILNVLGMNTPKGFIEYFLSRGTGLKTLNALDLQEGLQKNLKILQNLNGSNSDSEIISTLEKIAAKGPEPKIPTIEKGITTNSIAKAADLGNKKLPSTIKVNDYRSEFAKYLTPDQIDSAMEQVKQLGNKGKKLDMNVVKSVIKKFKPMSDISNASKK